MHEEKKCQFKSSKHRYVYRSVGLLLFLEFAGFAWYFLMLGAQLGVCVYHKSAQVI